MSARSRRAGRAAAALVACGVALAVAASAVAGFSFQASATQAVSTRTLVAPGTLTAAATGHDVQLSWSAGQNGSAYAVSSAANGSSSDCSGASFPAGSTTSATSFTDGGRSTPQGSWVCYRVQTTYGSWSSQAANPVAAVQIGFVAAAAAGANGGGAGSLDSGDRISVDFNQAVKTSSGPSSTDTVCITSGSPATLVLASTKTSGACSAAEATRLGTISGLGATQAARWRATYTWGSGNTTLIVTLGSLSWGSVPDLSASGSLFFDPTNSPVSLLSASGGYHVCDTNTAGSDCLADVSGGF